MKWLIIFLVFTLFLFPTVAGQQDLKISWDYSGLDFREFAEKTESLSKIRFFYKDEWIKDLRMPEFTGDAMLTKVLDNLFAGKSLFYLITESGNVIITKDFSVKVMEQPDLNEKSYITPSENENGTDDRQVSENMYYVIGNPADKNKPGSVVLSGYITDKETKEPVAGASIFIQKLLKGTSSNENGFYSINLTRGSHSLHISFIGMKERQINIDLFGSGELNVEMKGAIIPINEAIVTADRNLVNQRFEVGLEKINITSFKLLPTSLGEADIFKSILLIPGVMSVGEGSTGFNVRGGSFDQNLILLYGAPVYNSSHLFGFFSAVNPDIIKDVALYKGGIPARFGGRIASVLDISSRDGNRVHFKGNAGISPITTHLTIEGPIIKDKCTFILGGRTTYSNWIFSRINDPLISQSKASFYDLNTRIAYDIDKNDKVDFSAYLSKDSFRFTSDTTYSYENSIFALKWRHFFNSNLFFSLSLNNSYYRYDISGSGHEQESFILSHSINSTGFKADFNLYRGRNEVNFGLDLSRYEVMPGSNLPAGDSSLIVPDIIEKEKALEPSIYFEDKFVLNDYLSLNAGIRISTFFALGPNSILIYDPSISKSLSTVSDTLTFRSNELYKSYGGPEFRLSLNYRLSNKTSIKINYNRTRQYLHLLSNTTAISPSDTWKLSDYYLRPQIGDQYALGFYQSLPKGIEASVEIYFKAIQNMLDYKAGSRLVMNKNIEQDLVNVKGKAYGIEFQIKRSEGKFNWSLGYTYARTFLKSVSQFQNEMINRGNWFPANFDRPNDLIATFNYIFSRRLSYSTSYTWSTGRPITCPVSSYYVNDIFLINYSDRNKYRVPYYSRLDISLRVSGNLKSRRIAHPYWTFSVYNLLGRQNVYSVYFTNEKNTINGYKLSVFGRVIPSVTFSFDF
jgi:hypothetical protein